MDEKLRRAERDYFTTFAPEEKVRYKNNCLRAGLYFHDHAPVEILTEWEEIQQDYDDLAWQRTTAGRMGWDWEPRSGCGKAHHIWGHRWGGENSKRKTLRTHRNGKKRARNYRLPKGRKSPWPDEAPHVQRRKKRFAGRARRYGLEREWEWDENRRIVIGKTTYYYYRIPD